MADEVKKIDHFSMLIPNKPGAGAKVFAALRDGGVSFVGLWAYPLKAKKARVEMLPADSAVLKKAAKKAGLELDSKQTAFLICGEDRPGAVLDHLEKLAAVGINVHSVQALCAGAGRYGAAIYVDQDDVKKAAKALGA